MTFFPRRWAEGIRAKTELDQNLAIGSEKSNNPRLQVSSKEEYAEIMDNLNLANPKMMDIAVPANLKGLTLKEL